MLSHLMAFNVIRLLASSASLFLLVPHNQEKHTLAAAPQMNFYFISFFVI